MRPPFRWVALVVAVPVVGCGGGTIAAQRVSVTAAQRHVARVHASPRAAAPRRPSYPRVLGSVRTTRPTPFVPAVLLAGRPAVWVARSPSGVALLSFDQSLVTLALHSGTVDAGGSGWRWGPEVRATDRRTLVAAFNGGFKFDTGAGGFMSYGRVGAPLRAGLGSIVTYADGTTDVGAWHHGMPAPGRPVVSVRQNLSLLIDRGRAAPTLDCGSCWGATLGAVSDPARSAVGVTTHGRLIWAGGAHLTVSELASTLLAARVVRAVELDINPEWVAAYVYAHRGAHGPVSPVPVMPAQFGVPGQFLAPYSRDFFTIQAR